MGIGIGKLVGKVVGETMALPVTIVDETMEAVEEAMDTLGKRIEGEDEDAKDRS